MTIIEEINKIEKQLKTLEGKLIRKQSLLQKEKDLVKIEISVKVDGILRKKRVIFERSKQSYLKKGKSDINNFRWYLRYVMIAEDAMSAAGTGIDYLIDEYAEAFSLSEDDKEVLVEAFWHSVWDGTSDIYKQNGEFEEAALTAKLQNLIFNMGNFVHKLDKEKRDYLLKLFNI